MTYPLSRITCSIAILLFLWVGLFGQSLDTLKTYTSITLYNGDADTIYLDNNRYFGFFVKSNCTTENFATKVLSKKHCYKRITQNYSPRFIEIGRQSPLPILAGSITNEVDAINAIAYLAHIDGGGMIEIDSFYEIDQPIFLLDSVSFLGVSDSAGFIRSTPPITTLTRNAESGDDRIIVESTEGFRKFHRINIFSGKAYDELSSFTSYNGSVSSFLGGDTTLFLSGLKIQRPMVAGDTVSLLYPMMTPLFGTSNNIQIKNLTFDGNRVQNGFSYDWRVATTIVTPSSQDLVIENCTFNEIASENMFICGAKLINCQGNGFNGSTVHFSCLDGEYLTEVLYNDFQKVNEIGDSLMEHSEAALTFSAKVRNLRVSYNEIDSISEHGVGNFANDDYKVVITDNLFNSKKETINYLPFYTKDSLNFTYNNKNLNSLEFSDQDCNDRKPEVLESMACKGFSSFENPLVVGDTITLILDSVSVLNTNGNFLKCIEPIFSSDFFSLTSMSMSSKDLTNFHEWKTSKESEFCGGLIFDNGHRDGLYAPGNWGYEGCSKGDCAYLRITFVVKSLPEQKQEVDCPLTGLRIKFDGELGTWSRDINCHNSDITFSEPLGKPFLEGISSSTNEAVTASIKIIPNPAINELHILTKTEAIWNYRITSMAGIVCQRGAVEKSVDISELPSGTYIIEIEDQNLRFQFIKI